jgi:hypothetical protein
MTGTCFICSRIATKRDVNTGEFLCAQHHWRVDANREVSAKRNRLSDEWDMVARIQAWHAGSAYRRDKAMAARLKDVHP